MLHGWLYALVSAQEFGGSNPPICLIFVVRNKKAEAMSALEKPFYTPE